MNVDAGRSERSKSCLFVEKLYCEVDVGVMRVLCMVMVCVVGVGVLFWLVRGWKGKWSHVLCVY